MPFGVQVQVLSRAPNPDFFLKFRARARLFIAKRSSIIKNRPVGEILKILQFWCGYTTPLEPILRKLRIDAI